MAGLAGFYKDVVGVIVGLDIAAALLIGALYNRDIAAGDPSPWSLPVFRKRNVQRPKK